MVKKSVLGIATSRAQAEAIVSELKEEGFSNNDISAIFPDQEGSHDFAHLKATKAPEGAVTGAGGGAMVGGALGWLAGIGALAIPGVGVLVAAGPILAALSGAAVGGAVGGLSGAFVGLGIPEYEAKRFEGKLAAGNILISVHSEDAARAELAREIFEHFEAQDISTAGETKVDKKQGDVRSPEYHGRAM